jgi:hypothetical protein
VKQNSQVIGMWMFASAVITAVLASGSWAHEISPQKEKQMKAVFPAATKFSEQHVKLNSSQIKAIEKMIRGKVSPKHKNPTIFKAQTDTVLGLLSFFEAKEPDGDISPAVVGIRPDGAIAKVVIFTHHPENNPLAGRDFLDQFEGKKAGDAEAWHPDHTVKLVPSKQKESVAAMKAIRLTAAILTEASGAKTQQSAEPPRKETEREVSYQCPMKDSPPQSKPGRCPKCGMTLEKVEG